jgi:PPK2 family polyphosphate:nucleotide phosphotransferase
VAIHPQMLDHLLVRPGHRARLDERDTRWIGGELTADLSEQELRARAEERLGAARAELAEAQELLYADNTWSLLVVFQAMDAAGKDGTIKHVMSGVNPAGCQVFSFKQPSAEELDHDFLWRVNKALPERGRIGIFNRSYYEEVLIARVHPEILGRQQLPDGDRGQRFWQERYESINDWERHLDRNGTKIVKIFLHVSKDEQKERFLARLDGPDKLWKFSAADVRERQHWDAYQEAYEDAIAATSTEWAPWYVVPADRKWAMRVLTAGVIVQAIRSLDLQWPEVSDEDKAGFAAARAQLENEDPAPAT